MEKRSFNDDQKRFRLVMTNAGKLLIKKALPIIKDIRKMSTEDITEGELDVFFKVLNQIWENFDRYDTKRIASK